ncbi:MAG TPA: RNA 2'-phosphotransferase [Reyranella sp.]|nr:RNA 2'-phosphotransferase [Reyranella sp.]
MPRDLDLTRVSRTLSHALRHEPWLYELELDGEGWTSVDAVLAALREERREWRDLTADDIARVVETSSKRRYEMADGRLRALYGHSLPGKLARTLAAPPAQLFHGTSPASLEAIRAGGLRPMSRQYVHLSIDRAGAREVGRRKSTQPVLLAVRATDAHAAGTRFYEGNEKVWLSDVIPWTFLAIDG